MMIRQNNIIALLLSSAYHQPAAFAFQSSLVSSGLVPTVPIVSTAPNVATPPTPLIPQPWLQSSQKRRTMPHTPHIPHTPRTALAMSTSSSAASTSNTENASESKSYLYVPSERDEHYNGNIAQYLLDLDREGATFDFCGGMMFQLVLTDKLKTHLQSVANQPQTTQTNQQPIIHPSSMPLMSRIPNYSRSSSADNISTFHGREIRRVKHAKGGMGFVLQLSYADPTNDAVDPVDPQGWTANEIASYDGWLHDGNRQWRQSTNYESEEFDTFSEQFGKEAFGLHHRFYLHSDGGNRMWLSAEDGCEGTPASRERNVIEKLGGVLFGM